MSGQPIPRPAAARPGGPPPWADAVKNDGERPRITVEQVRAALVGDHQLPEVLDMDDGLGSAVLAPIFEEDGEARVILTRRTPWLRSHSGQVSFPGGRVEPGESAVDAALRETWEEVGIDPATVDVVGELSRLRTISSSAGIHPFVGVLSGRPVLDPNPDEVGRAFDVALGELMADGVFTEEIWGVDDTERSIFFFEVDGETIWGATARILFELLILITGESS